MNELFFNIMDDYYFQYHLFKQFDDLKFSILSG